MFLTKYLQEKRSLSFFQHKDLKKLKEKKKLTIALVSLSF